MLSKIACGLRSLGTQPGTRLTMTTTAFAALAAVSIGSHITANAAIGGIGSVADLFACTSITNDESAASRPPAFDKRWSGSLDALPGLCHVLNPPHDIDEQSGQ